MSQNSTINDTLLELINNSQAIQGMPEDQKQAAINQMIEAPDEEKEEFIKILQEEEAQNRPYIEQIQKAEEEIALLEGEKKIIMKDIKKHETKVKEAKSNIEDEKNAEMLLSKLDDIL